ncbi:peptidase [Xylariaceae sp. FL0594]|nr:peptidase [Xylariaceae sp. FL0594]
MKLTYIKPDNLHLTLQYHCSQFRTPLNSSSNCLYTPYNPQYHEPIHIMPSTILAKALEPGATVAFVSPSLRLNHTFPAVMQRATSVLESKGYKVREIYTRDKGVQDRIANQLSELRTAFTDTTIDAIICTIGGTTFTELLPALIADTALQQAIRAHPKVVIGYSDITGLHWFLHATTGLRTFYGPGAIPELGELASVDDEKSALAFTVRNLLRAVADPTTPIGNVDRSPTYMAEPPSFFIPGKGDVPNELVPNDAGWTWIRRGRGEGRLFGGCLTVMARLAGVRAIAPDWRGRIVFLESAAGEDDRSGSPIHRVQAAIADLIAQGVFDDAAGLVVGRPIGYDTPDMREQYVGVVRALLCEGPRAKQTFPILFNVDIGHTSPMVTLPFDALACLDSEKDQFAILESAVV